MANIVTTTVTTDNNYRTIVVVNGRLDTSDLPGTVILDVANLQPIDPLSRKKASGLGFIDVDYSVTPGIIVDLYFDGTTPELIHSFIASGEWPAYIYDGGRAPKATTVKNGKITISTRGAGAGGDVSFSIKAEFYKMSG